MGAVASGRAARPDRRYMDHVVRRRRRDRTCRAARRENEKSVLYPAIGLGGECEVTDPEIDRLPHRAYNRWTPTLSSDGWSPGTDRAPALSTPGRPRRAERAVAGRLPRGLPGAVHAHRSTAGHDVVRERAPSTSRAAATRPTSRRGRRRCGSRGWGARRSSSTTSCCARACSRRSSPSSRSARSIAFPPCVSACSRPVRAGSAPSSIAWTPSTTRSRPAGWR